MPDANDRHVLAAAIHAGVSIIVTQNLSDFPKSALLPYEIEALSVDAFVMRLIHSSPDSAEKVLNVIREQRANLRNPPKSASDYMEIMSRQGLKQFVKFLQEHQEEI